MWSKLNKIVWKILATQRIKNRNVLHDMSFFLIFFLTNIILEKKQADKYYCLKNCQNFIKTLIKSKISSLISVSHAPAISVTK